MNACLNKVCKCALSSDPDACGCTLAAGAALVGGVPCVACGAPLVVVDDAFQRWLQLTVADLEERRLVHVPRVERYAALSFSAVLAPGERREIFVETKQAFRAERLSLLTPPQSRARRFLTYLWYVPWVMATTLGVLMRKATDRTARREWTWPSWRAPRPGPPVQILNVKVDAVEQFVEDAGPLPPQIFTDEAPRSPYLGMQTSPSGQKITLVVRSTSKKPYELEGYFVGKELS